MPRAPTPRPSRSTSARWRSREKALGPEHPDTALLAQQSRCAVPSDRRLREGRTSLRARARHHEKALGPEHPDTARSLNNLAGLNEVVGAYAKAEPLFERAQGIDEINTARFLLSGDEARKRAYLQQRRGNAYVDASFSLAVADPRAKALGLTAVLQYKGRVLDAMADSVALLRRSVDPKDQALFDELAAVAQQLSTLTFRGPGNLSAPAYRERLDTLAHEQERLEGELSARSAAFRQAVAPVTLEGVRQGLPADAALVEWFRYQPFDPKVKDEKTRWGAPRYVAYVLRREGDPAAIDLGAAQDIDKLVGDFRAALSDPARTSYKEVAQELFGKLIEPLRSSLSGINRLLLSPDGALNLRALRGAHRRARGVCRAALRAHLPHQRSRPVESGGASACTRQPRGDGRSGLTVRAQAGRRPISARTARATWTAAAWCSRRLRAPPPRPRRCKGCSSSMRRRCSPGQMPPRRSSRGSTVRASCMWPPTGSS